MCVVGVNFFIGMICRVGESNELGVMGSNNKLSFRDIEEKGFSS